MRTPHYPRNMTWTHIAFCLSLVLVLLLSQQSHLCKAQDADSESAPASENTETETVQQGSTSQIPPQTNAEGGAPEAQNAGVNPQSVVDNAISSHSDDTPQYEVHGNAIASLPSSTAQTTGDAVDNEQVGQGVQRPSPNVNLASSEDVFVQGLNALNNFSSIEDIVASGLIYKNGHQATLADLGASINSSTGKVYINNNEEYPKPDQCGIRPSTIHVNISQVDASLIVYPRCIEELRCGGCCQGPHIMCKPTYTETKQYKLLLLRPVRRNDRVSLEHDGYHTIRVDRHLLCKCECSLTADTCGEKKYLDASRCNCECKNRPTCRSPTVFNEATCACECPDHLQAACPTPLDPSTCNCGRSYISANRGGSNNHGQTEVDSNNHGQMEVDSNNHGQMEQETTATAATTTTTTTTTEADDPCANINCPPNHNMVRVLRFCMCRSMSEPVNRRPRTRRPRTGDRPRRAWN